MMRRNIFLCWSNFAAIAMVNSILCHHRTSMIVVESLQQQVPISMSSSSRSGNIIIRSTTSSRRTVNNILLQAHDDDDDDDGINSSYDDERNKVEEASSDNISTGDCHFNRQSTDDTNNDCYVFDYEVAASHYGEDKDHLDMEFWNRYESQNKARQKFGLQPLTREEYVVLQVETKAMGDKLSQEAIQTAFIQFDTNGDGVISLQELQIGIRDVLRTELSDEHIETVLQHLDTSGDGVLQLEEMVALDELRKRLEAVIREEQKQLKLEKTTTGKTKRQTTLSSQRQHQQPGLLKSFLAAFRLTDEHACQSNLDCIHPEVCCDFHFKKFCCSSGEMAHQLQLQYATVPVPQQS